jgi:hypothetical protein
VFSTENQRPRETVFWERLRKIYGDKSGRTVSVCVRERQRIVCILCRLERTRTCKLGDLQGLTSARRGVPGSTRTTNYQTSARSTSTWFKPGREKRKAKGNKKLLNGPPNYQIVTF